MTRNLNRSLAAGAIGFAMLLGGTAAWAHHEPAAKFDVDKPITLTGVVSYVDWRNPHAHLFMNVTTGKQTANWAVELESPSLLEIDGWKMDQVKPGDKITVKGGPARDKSRQIWGADVRVNGAAVFAPKDKTVTKMSGKPAPKWPDGHPALGAVPGAGDGYWTDPSETALVEDGVNVKMDAYGLLANLNDAAKVAPMQPWALELYRYRQSRQLRDDPTYKFCKPPAGPRQYQSRLGFQLVEDIARQRVFVLEGAGNRNFRIIYLDGRPPKGLVTGDDENLLYFGRNNGKWEGNTFVVTLQKFNEDFWFTQGGLPHTELLKLTEKFTRVDMDTLRYEVEVDDPGAYTRKWSASWTLKWNAGGLLPSHFCQNNRQ
jgi:hypothetical protein